VWTGKSIMGPGLLVNGYAQWCMDRYVPYVSWHASQQILCNFCGVGLGGMFLKMVGASGTTPFISSQLWTLVAFAETKSLDLYVCVAHVLFTKGQLSLPSNSRALDCILKWFTSLDSAFVGITSHLRRVSLAEMCDVWGLHNREGSFLCRIERFFLECVRKVHGHVSAWYHFKALWKEKAPEKRSESSASWRACHMKVLCLTIHVQTTPTYQPSVVPDSVVQLVPNFSPPMECSRDISSEEQKMLGWFITLSPPSESVVEVLPWAQTSRVTHVIVHLHVVLISIISDRGFEAFIWSLYDYAFYLLSFSQHLTLVNFLGKCDQNGTMSA
ncbi:hypothetical protein MTR67_002921, partial [Solanum verrucosum]